MKPADSSSPPEAEKKDEQQLSSSRSSSPKSEGVSLSKNLIKSMRRKNNTSSSKGSDGGQSSGSSNGAGGNNSDNSALVSLGNTSFGFNFDSEEGNSSTPNSDRNGESDSDGGNGNNSSEEAARSKKASSRVRSSSNNKRRENKQHTGEKKQEAEVGSGSSSETNTSSITNSNNNNSNSGDNQEGRRPLESVPQHEQAEESDRKSNSSMTSSLSSSDGAAATVSHTMAADAAVANLHTLASEYISQDRKDEGNKEATRKSNDDKNNNNEAKSDNDIDNDSNGGYNTDDEGVRGLDRKIAASRHSEATTIEPVVSAPAVSVSGTSGSAETKKKKAAPASIPGEDTKTSEPPKKKKKGGGDQKREERNAREKERSFRISKQINELRELLSTGGVIVPKGTKSSVLTEAASYIRMLQQHQYRSEIDRHQLVQQIQMIGGGAHGPQAAQAIRHVAAKNGVWSLGNFGGVPPKSAMGYYGADNNAELEMQPPVDPMQQTKIEEHEYRSVFSNCAVGMAIASMGGAFIDCNQLFCQLSNYSKQEACALTIFNLTARQDLQHAFDLISQLISPPMDAPDDGIQQPIVLRGAMNNRNDLGLGVALVKGDDGIAKFFCVTLIKNPASPFDESPPIPATIELIQGTPTLTPSQEQGQMAKDSPPVDSAPAFTTG